MTPGIGDGSRGVALATSFVLSLVFTALILAWLAFREGIFAGPETLDRRGVEDAGEAVSTDAGVEDGGGPSIGLGGIGRLSARRLTIEDKQKRNVLRVRNVRAAVDLRAMRRGAIRVPNGHVEGVELTLFRDPSGKMSIASAFRDPDRAQPDEEPPQTETDEADWIIGAGPVTLKDVVLTLGFMDKPVQLRVDRGIVRVRRGQSDSGPVIYFDDIEGALLKPRPLPRPVRIAYAKGVVRLEGRPLVEMVARTCLGISELRIRAIVPRRKQPAELTATSIGVGGLLGRTVLNAVAGIKSDKIDYKWGFVKLKGGKNCLQPATRDEATIDSDGALERSPPHLQGARP
jgi:hypothetical protein